MSFVAQVRGEKGTAAGINWRLGTALMVAAGILYSLHLGRSFGASETYSALAASQSKYAAVIRMAERFDPGKPPLYQIVLHAFARIFGDREIALRSLSVLFSMVNVGLVLVLGTEMSAWPVGIVAAVMWALNPLAIIFGGWARMYAMLITTALGQFLALWRLRSRPGAGYVIACGLLGAAALYTHLGAALFLGAEALMLARTTWRGQPARSGWLALLISVILFLPFVPTASGQIHGLIFGHWVDWIGPAHHQRPLFKASVILAAGSITALLLFAPAIEGDEREPLRWCAAAGLIPIVALAAGSLAIRPMFAIRYVAPSVAVTVMLVAGSLGHLSERAFRLSSVIIITGLVCLLPFYPRYEPWRDTAALVAKGAPTEPVFFEAGFVASDEPIANAKEGFPQGYFRVPFDYYYSGSNPRRVIDPSQAALARETIARAATVNSGAWLVSGFTEQKAQAELPAGCFRVEKKASCSYAALYHVTPLTLNHCKSN